MKRTGEYYFTKVLNLIVDLIIAFLLICIFAYACFAFWDTWNVINAPKQIQQQLEQYNPSKVEDLSRSFEELLTVNPDICAWITINNTQIDYPVAQGKTNFDYLSTDIYGEYAVSGSIFLDCDNNTDFTDWYSVLMGHHMQGGAMFGDIDLFTNEKFFSENISGVLYLPDRELILETVAIINADAYDNIIYDVKVSTEEEKTALVKRINDLALFTRGELLNTENRLIALSTCSADYTNARLILLCCVTEESISQAEKETQY